MRGPWTVDECESWADYLALAGRFLAAIAIIAYSLHITVFLTHNFSKMVAVERDTIRIISETLAQWKP